MGLGMSCFACAACSVVCSTLSAACSCAGCLCSGASPTPRDLMVGKLRSMGLVILSIILGLVAQYILVDFIDNHISNWSEGCDDNKVCTGNMAILRMSMVDGIFFALMTLGALTSSLFNNRCWMLKLVFWLFLLVGSVFVPNEVFDDRGFVWAARVGAFFFILLQQIVLIDIAYSWNDAWVKKASDLGEDSAGKGYLIGLVVASVFLYLASISVIGVLFGYFSGCADNEIILSLTLILCVVITIVQLAGTEGNLLASALVTAYAVFLAFSAVGKNPKSECNPFIGSSQNVTSIIIGLLLTVLSLAWICGSAGTSVTKLLGGDTPPTTVESVANAETAADGQSPSGTLPFIAPVSDSMNKNEQEMEEPDDHGDGWKFNIVMVLISMFFGMMLTNWGVVQSNDDGSDDSSYSDPKNGEAAMWITASSQWACLLLYLWTLVAPALFPNRDFS